jgi:hypothetical protein
MAVGTLTPGILYFLQLEPIGDFGPFPFYKLGYTKDNVETRINQLKTGNPFIISVKDHFHSEAAGHIELKLHRKYQKNNQNLEWFRFDSEDVINEVIEQARKWDAELRDVVTKVRELDDTVSNGQSISATDEVLALAGEYKTKDEQRQTALRELDEHKQIIIAEGLMQGAVIEGALQAKVSTARPDYDWDAIQIQHAEPWADCKRPMKIKNPSSFNADYRKNKREIPESDKAKKRRLSNSERLAEMQDVFADDEVKQVPPNATVRASQQVIAKKKRQIDYLKYEALEIKMKVALACDESDAIDGVFNWVRTEIEDTAGQQRQFKRKYRVLLIQKPISDSSKAGKVTLRVS